MLRTEHRGLSHENTGLDTDVCLKNPEELTRRFISRMLRTEHRGLSNENTGLDTDVTMQQCYTCHSFDILLTVHLSIFISVINQLDARNFCFTISLFHASTCFEHHVLIIRRSKLHCTASGIITPMV